MSDDALVINRQSEVPDLLAYAFTGFSYDGLADKALREDEAQGYLECIASALTALGVGQPEQQVRLQNLRSCLELAEEYVEQLLDGPTDPAPATGAGLPRIRAVVDHLEGKKP